MNDETEKLKAVIGELLAHCKNLADDLRVVTSPDYVPSEKDGGTGGYERELARHHKLVAKTQSFLNSLDDEPEVPATELDDWRQVAADHVYENFDFTYEVEDADGWEWAPTSDEWTRTVYVRRRGDGPATKATLAVHFEPGNDTVDDCSALVGGSELIKDTMGLSARTRGPSV